MPSTPARALSVSHINQEERKNCALTTIPTRYPCSFSSTKYVIQAPCVSSYLYVLYKVRFPAAAATVYLSVIRTTYTTYAGLNEAIEIEASFELLYHSLIIIIIITTV